MQACRALGLVRAAAFALRVIAIAITIASAAVFSGCATLAPPVVTADNGQLKTGRFSVTAYQKDQQTVLERQSGGFSAEITEKTARLDLVSPLGQIMARVSVAPNLATIETAQGQKFTDSSENADQKVTEQALGIPLPLLGLSKNLVSGQSIAVPGWNTEFLESVNQRPKRLRMTWIRQSDESKHFDTLLNSEIGRIVVLVIINE
jgi:Outer membrane lipoprotein LolB